jgi:glycosyltransferase involved in cell wall biosynthesis
VRVWIVNHHADPPDGFATRSFDIARRLVERGHPTTIFLSNFNHYLFRDMRDFGWWPWKAELVDGVTLVWIRTPAYARNDIKRVMNMVSFAIGAIIQGTIRRERPDVVIGVSVHPLAALAGYVIARLRRARFFVEVTDLWPETLIQFGRLRRGSLAARLMLGLERFLYRRAERILMLWRDTRDYVESIGVPAEKIVWLPHGVELARYEGLTAYEGAPRPPFRVVYLGSFVSGMSLDTIIDAAAELKSRGRRDIEFRLVGAGTQRDELIERATSLSLDNVTFPDAVPKAEIAQVLNQADAFIYGLQDLPLYQYGMSTNKVMDYLASARPIVFFGNSSYDPVAIAEAGISLPPGDAVALASAIERLVGMSPKERVAMGERGRAYLLEHHTIPALTDRLLAALGTDA